jgi:hypothetical protein
LSLFFKETLEDKHLPKDDDVFIEIDTYRFQENLDTASPWTRPIIVNGVPCLDIKEAVIKALALSMQGKPYHIEQSQHEPRIPVNVVLDADIFTLEELRSAVILEQSRHEG